MPTLEKRRPSDSEMSALGSELPPSETTEVRPSRITAKYSGVDSLSAMTATGPDRNTIAIAANRPPARAAKSVQPSARAGSPARAIG